LTERAYCSLATCIEKLTADVRWCGTLGISHFCFTCLALELFFGLFFPKTSAFTFFLLDCPQKKSSKETTKKMLEVPESHITLGVYSSKRGIGTAKKEEEPIPVWLIVVIAVICLLLMIALVYFFTRSGKTEATSASTKAAV
jgi:hypothetical protein